MGVASTVADLDAPCRACGRRALTLVPYLVIAADGLEGVVTLVECDDCGDTVGVRA